MYMSIKRIYFYKYFLYKYIYNNISSHFSEE